MLEHDRCSPVGMECLKHAGLVPVRYARQSILVSEGLKRRGLGDRTLGLRVLASATSLQLRRYAVRDPFHFMKSSRTKGELAVLVFQGWPEEAAGIIGALKRAGIAVRLDEALVPAPPPPIVGVALTVCRAFVASGSEQEARDIVGQLQTRQYSI